MKPINIPAAQLKPLVAGLAKVISRRPTLPVLGHVLVTRAESAAVSFTVTDLDVHLTGTVEGVEAGDPTTLLVPFGDLNDAVRACSRNDVLSLAPAGKERVSLAYPVAGHPIAKTCETVQADEFPPVPEIPGTAAQLDEAVRASIQQALQCVSNDETRLILNGAYLDVSRPDAHYVVGTDGRHLFSSNSFTLPSGISLVVPNHRFLASKLFNSDGTWKLRVGPPVQEGEEPRFEIASNHWRFVARAIGGNYPNWRQVVPNGSSTKTRVSIDEPAVTRTIEFIERLPDTDAANHSIGLEFSRRTAALLVRAAADGPRTRVPLEGVQVQGRHVTLFVNRNLLTKALRFGLAQIDIIDEMSPLRFWNGGRQMIVMPIRTDVGPAHHQTFRPASATAPRADTNSPPQTADNRKEETTMPETNGTTTTARSRVAANGNTNAAAATPVEAALAQIETIKGSYREAIRGLNELADLLKQASREQKNHEKEISSVRQTLRQIQAVRI